MKPIRPKTLPCEILVERGILQKAGALLSPRKGGSRRFLWLCDLPDTDPAPSAVLASLEKAGHTVVRVQDEDYPRYPEDFDAILAVGDEGKLGAALCSDDVPYVLVPTTFHAQLDFPFGDAAGLVLCDPSLPVGEADFRRGVVELIRYAVGFDRLLFDLLYTDFDRAAVIRRCLSIRFDLLDAGKTALFNRLGTSFGWAVRAALHEKDPDNDDEIDLADTYAIGLAAATRYALKTGYCRQDFLSDLVGLLSYRGLPNSALVSDEELRASFLALPWEDGGKATVSLPRRLGECGLVTVNPGDLVGLLPS
ncbi:MAG: hypothetical protein IKX66_06510 [Clostridia bacterium]|nr:hypothetical protein [Clostridia bacterium]